MHENANDGQEPRSNDNLKKVENTDVPDQAIFQSSDYHDQAIPSNEPLTVTCVIAYFIFSSTMLILNKAALNVFPFPVTVTAMQTVSSAAMIHFLRLAGFFEYPSITLRKLIAWKWVAAVFTVTLICNMQAIRYLGVEAVMTFRSSTTVFVAIFDYLVFDSKISIKQACACCIIGCGGLCYAAYDLKASNKGLAFGFLYAGSIVLNTIYMKHLFTQQKEMGSWEKTFLNNLTSSPLIILLACQQEDIQQAYARLVFLTNADVAIVLLSCVGGFGISVSGTFCRHALSATGFDVLGNSTKYATLLFNAVTLGSQTTAHSMFGVLIALTGGVVYSPSSSVMCSHMRSRLRYTTGIVPESLT